MIRINLLPVRAAQKKEKLVSQVVILVGALVLVALGCGALQGLLISNISDYEKKISSTESEIKALNKKFS